MRQPKYLYIVSSFERSVWVGNDGAFGGELCGHKLIHPIHHYEPENSRDAARKLWLKGLNIYQFENKPPYKFVKQVR